MTEPAVAERFSTFGGLGNRADVVKVVIDEVVVFPAASRSVTW